MFEQDQEFSRHVSFALSLSGARAPLKGVVVLERCIILALALLLSGKLAAGIFGLVS